MSLLAFCGAAQAASPCAAGTEPAFELRIVATSVSASVDRTTTVRVHDDGCVDVHRPSFRRDAGDWRLDLDAPAFAALRRDVDHAALRGFDAKRLRADLAAAERRRDGDARRTVELDADDVDIRWRSGGKRYAAAWPGLPGAAKQNPDNAALQALDKAATALKALAERGDAARIGGDRP